MEVFAEDPTTVAALGHAYVQGIQHGDVGAPSTDILLIASSPKQYVHTMHTRLLCSQSACASLQLTCVAALHSFADYNLDHYGTADRNTYNAVISAHDMRETYLAGFKAVAPDIQGFMCSVNEVNGTYGPQISSQQMEFDCSCPRIGTTTRCWGFRAMQQKLACTHYH